MEGQRTDPAPRYERPVSDKCVSCGGWKSGAFGDLCFQCYANGELTERRPEYIQRVVVERNELVSRLGRLRGFLRSDRVHEVSFVELLRMNWQLWLMVRYVAVLNARLKAWSNGK